MKDYKQIWDNLSTNFDEAAFYVCCIDDEDEIRSNGQLTAAFLREVLQITPDDRVLEIGCGVARIGRELAPYCGEWYGVDISGNMIEYGKERTAHLSNVFMYEQPESNLAIFPDNYFDCVYCSIVFMHLDKLEMFTYIREAYRVLRPGGRAYFDTYNLLAPEAWEEFLKTWERFPPHARPGHVSQFSTPQEMRKFVEETGFDSVHIDGEHSPQLVVALGVKPGEPVPRVERAEFEARLAEKTGNRQLRSSEQRKGEGEQHGVRAARTGSGQIEYIRQLEEAVASKNAHIEKLEKLVQRDERMIARLTKELQPGAILRRAVRKVLPGRR